MNVRTRMHLGAALFVAACKLATPSAPNVVLDDATVEKYIRAYKNLRALGPDIAKQYQGPTIPDGQADFARIDKAVKDAGFSGYSEFVLVNGKIGWAFSNLQARAALQKNDRDVSEGEKTLEKNLADPKVPPAAKAEMRKALETLRATQEKNKPWADMAMTLADKLTDDASLQVVGRHRQEIEAAYSAKN